MPKRPSIRLPDQWPDHVKSGVLHAISLASVALSYARGRATGRRRLRAELDPAKTEIAHLREELAIKDARCSRSHSRRRPYYLPVQRMRILQLRSARGGTLESAPGSTPRRDRSFSDPETTRNFRRITSNSLTPRALHVQPSCVTYFLAMP